MLRKCYTAMMCAALSFAAAKAFGQSPTPAPKPVDAVASAPKPNPATAPHVPADKFKRWVEIDALAAGTRYRYIDNRAGLTVFNHFQYQVNARGRFKFDRKGRYSVYAVIGTGNNFTGGWDNTGVGTGDFQGDIFFKQLYFDAKPAKWFEVQFGGIAPNNGENSEITGYDTDAYLMGERAVVRRPKDLFFDEISATNAYIGDVTQPNVFRRFKRLEVSNYHQILVRKQVNKRVGFSADYTFEAGRDFLRQAVKVRAPELKVVDIVHFENYEVVDPNPGYGFGFWGEKTVNKKFSYIGGFARIDRVMLNGDRYPRGNRLFFGATYKITREFAVNPGVIRAVGPLATPATHRTRFEIIFSYNFLELLRHHKVY